MPSSLSQGYLPVNGVDMYWESRGSGGTPLVIVHGGYGLVGTLGDLPAQLARHRRVVAVELQGHGHTRDTARPFTFEAFGDDLAGLIDGLDLGPADLLGYSLGAGTCLRAALQHPHLVRRLALISFPCRRDGWHPEVRVGFDAMGRDTFAVLRQSPLYQAWLEVAPDREAFPALMDKTGELLRRPYDWTDEVRGMTVPTLLAYGDADSISPAHAAEFFALLGGGVQDPGWDGTPACHSRLAVLPGVTHYDIFTAAHLLGMLERFLD